MNRLCLGAATLALLSLAGGAQAHVWNFDTSAADYYLFGSATGGYHAGGVDVAPLPDDEAAVFARINTQALFRVGDITGGGFTLSGMNNPDAVYGSLYLSPTGGSGSTVMINMSPMSRTGSAGDFVYTFDLSTACDVKLRDGAGGGWGTAHYAGNFGGAIGWVNGNGYGNTTYAAFFGPQIGMSGTHDTQFTVTQIQLQAVPEPFTMSLGIAGAGLFLRRRLKAKKS